ncbi:MAG: HAD hydrolase-like protein [Methylophilus sp.]|nr:HAD hydrolase-like protein [Methylophilus sp.]
MLKINKYKTIVFDCDGVILDSNIIKTEAYFRTAKNLGATDAQAQALVDYHVKLGGISRYHKFDWYVREVLNQPVTELVIQTLLDAFSKELEEGLMTCAIADDVQALRDATPQTNWMILSGGDQEEIRQLFAKREIASGQSLASLFDGGLFGSPANKDEVLARELTNGNVQLPALFVGDSKYDFEASSRAGLDFVFVSDWTEVPQWEDFCKAHQITVLNNISQLLD